ncbi:MAG: serine/threonine protein kinase [Planctomycetales bacterium]|nr:serine/threonine protein kinase [Planctomycetales bacterium]
MLRLHDQAGGFMQNPGAFAPTNLLGSDALPEKPGALVGHYKLLQQIGEGGMGVVFMAEQEQPVRRKVALKIIKPGMDSRQVIARFEAERQALAMMDHTNIAKVLDAGTTESGRPYFVMELVHGVPITEYCDAHHLSNTERLELFVPVCQALQHAHQKGIIHRDVKPSNILVTQYDDKPVPKVIDFGVAKAVEQRLTEKTLFTQYGALVGTFEYMSPEQAELNAFGVDTRSDVYSLGVLLYELLTGTTPLEKTRLRSAAYGELIRMIKEEEPPRPSVRISMSGTIAKLAAARKTDASKLSSLVKGELDWIVMKCLEKDRTRRYDGASGLAKDVQRYLTGDAVEACPPTMRYRLRKVYRKNRVAVLTTGLIVAVLVTSTGVSSAFAVLAKSAEMRALRSEEEAHALAQKVQAALVGESKQREQAEITLSQLLTVLDSFTTPTSGDTLLAQRDITEEQKQLYRTAIEYYEYLSEQKGTDTKTRSRIAASALRAADLAELIGDEEQAIKALKIAIPAYTDLVGESSESLVYQKQLAESHLQLGNLYGWRRHNPAEGIRHLQSARELYDALASSAPDTLEYRTGQFACHRGLGVTYFELGKIDDADKEMAEATRIMRKLASDNPRNLEYQFDISNALLGQSAVFARSGRGQQSKKPFHESMEIMQTLVEQPNVSARDRLKYGGAYTQMLHNLGRFYQEDGKLALAEHSFRESLSVGGRFADEFQSAPFLQRVIGRSHDSLGITLAATGNLSEAVREWETARQTHEKSLKTVGPLPKTTWELAHTEGCLGRFHRDKMELQQSQKLLTDAINRTSVLRVQEYTMMAGEGALPHLLGERAITHDRMQNWREALSDWDEAIEHCREFRKEDEAAYRLGRLTTEIQSGAISLDEAMTRAESEKILEGAIRSLNRQYLVARFYAVAASVAATNGPTGSDSQNKYAEAAIDQLKVIVDKRGPCFIDMAPGNTDFTILRTYDSFRALEESIQARIQDTNPELIDASQTQDTTDIPGP